MAKKILKRKDKTSVPTRKPVDLIDELEVLKAKKKDIEKREKILKADLGEILEGEGVVDSKGSFKLLVGDMLAQKQARKRVSLDHEKAEELFKELGIWEDVTETMEVINEDFVAQAVSEGKLSMEELEEVTEVKLTYAIVVTKYKPEEDSEMPMIEVN